MKDITLVFLILVVGFNAFSAADAEVHADRYTACKAVSADIELEAKLNFQEEYDVRFSEIQNPTKES